MWGVRVLTSVTVGALTVVGSLSLATAASAAKGAAPRCGDTITTNVTLTKNLVCVGDGLTVGAAGLTINLNGHTLAGSGAGVAIAGGTDLTVMNGTIRSFDVGVRGSADTRSVTFRSNRVGMLLTGGGGTVTDSTFDSNSAGLIHGLGDLTVTGSAFRSNGVALSCGDANIYVASSRFVDNATGITGSVCGARIASSRFAGGDVGVELHSQGYFLDVRDNTFVGAGVGMRLSGIGDATHAVVRNLFKDNRASGLVVLASDAAWGYPVQIQGNTFTGNGFSPGSNADPAGNQLTAGVWANAGTFAKNKANDNAGHGIETYGVVDGNGNSARSNGSEPQCVGVVCTAR